MAGEDQEKTEEATPKKDRRCQKRRQRPQKSGPSWVRDPCHRYWRTTCDAKFYERTDHLTLYLLLKIYRSATDLANCKNDRRKYLCKVASYDTSSLYLCGDRWCHRK